MPKKMKKNKLQLLQKSGAVTPKKNRDYESEIAMEFVKPEDIIIMPPKSTDVVEEVIENEEDIAQETQVTEVEVVEETPELTEEEKAALMQETSEDGQAKEEETEDERDERIKRAKSDLKDFRNYKRNMISKLPKAQRSKKIRSEKELTALVVNSKQSIYEKSNKSKMLKKYHVKPIYKEEFDRLYLEKSKRIVKMIMLFYPNPEVNPIPIEEVYWAIQNEVASQRKIYKDKKVKPFHKIEEFAFCDYLVWSTRYLFEMMYDYDDYTLDYLKDDCFRLSKQIYSRLNQKNAFGAERASIELMDYLLDKYSWVGESDND